MSSVEQTTTPPGHEVEVTYVGSAKRPRLTCFTCSVSLERQAQQGAAEWQKLGNEFLHAHPAAALREREMPPPAIQDEAEPAPDFPGAVSPAAEKSISG